MFHISRIYNTNTMFSAKSLYSSYRTHSYSRNKDNVRMSTDGLGSIMCEVYDSNDGVCEWYSLADILFLVYVNKIEISHVKCSFYTDYMRKGLTVDNIVQAVKELYIYSDLYVADKVFLSQVTKGKLLGLDINKHGLLLNIIPALVSNKALTLPNFVKRLTSNINFGQVSSSSFNKIVIEADDFDLFASQQGLDKLVNFCNEDLCLVVPNFRFYSKFLDLNCNLYCRSEFDLVNMRRLKTAVKEYYSPYKDSRVRFIANDKWIYEYKISTHYTNKIVNNGKIVF